MWFKELNMLLCVYGCFNGLRCQALWSMFSWSVWCAFRFSVSNLVTAAHSGLTERVHWCLWMENALQTTVRKSLLNLWTLSLSLSPHPGLHRSGTQRAESFLRWPVGSWQSISRYWRRTPPGAAPTSPAGCWGCVAPPGCSPAPNCTLTEGDRRKQIQKRVGIYSLKFPVSVPILAHHFHSLGRQEC